MWIEQTNIKSLRGKTKFRCGNPKGVTFHFLHNLAFTLAEILITLGIIGVVAALTIPNLIASYQKQSYVTGLKKFYSTLSNAVLQIQADTSCDSLSCVGLFETPGESYIDWWHPSKAAAEYTGTEFIKYFKISKNCGTTGQGCMYTKVDSGDWAGWGGAGDTHPDGYHIHPSYYRFITADGMSVAIFPYGANCHSGSGYVSKKGCGLIYVDVNGFKAPNDIGRDQFLFELYNGGNGVVPYGKSGFQGQNPWKNNSGVIVSCIPDASGKIPVPPYGSMNASTCTGRVIDSGWQMEY